MAKARATVIDMGPVTLPVNVDQCQVEIRTEPGAETMFRFGPPPQPRECGQPVEWIGNKNGGAMGLCEKHKRMAEKELSGVTLQPVVRCGS